MEDIEKNKDCVEDELLKELMVVNSIFSDLSNLIQNQGEKIDSITENIDIIPDSLSVVNTELEKIKTYKDSIDRKYLTLAGIGGILVWLLIF
jgi:hypothetical protein